jgi:hypothetical protein
MMKTFLLNSVISLASVGAVHAQDLSREVINNADLSSFSSENSEESAPNDQPDPVTIHLQVLLDRAGASPGVIDDWMAQMFGKPSRDSKCCRDFRSTGSWTLTL